MKANFEFLRKLFPAEYVCVSCGKEYGGNNRYNVCDECASTLPLIGLYCEKCGRETEKKHCARCRNDKLAFEKNRAVFNYEGNIKDSYLKYKFGDKKHAAKDYAEFLTDLYYLQGYHCDAVCGVPSFFKDKKILNHGELLAKEVADKLGLPFITTLRKKDVPKQVGLSGKARRDNAKDAYYVERDNFSHKTILLIDDVMTTGSTLDSVAKTLIGAGARRVYALTLFAVPERE